MVNRSYAPAAELGRGDPPQSHYARQRLFGNFLGRTSMVLANALIYLASPRGFEPLLPP
jgi:hypothetical protein